MQSMTWARRKGARTAATVGALSALLAACGGGDGSTEATRSQAAATDGASATVGQAEAVLLAQQASFGPTEALVAQIRAAGPAAWVKQQMSLSSSAYTHGGSGAIHRSTSPTSYCERGTQKYNAYCWRDNYSTEPLSWDFYRNAVSQPDQLRQRVALALSHMLVVSGHEISATYGMRSYHNTLLEQAFGNYRDVLRKVTLSPVMGDYLDHVNNDRFSPNENFARELLQLFSLGTCLLRPDGRLQGGSCQPVYNNATVRNYAFALTGWTYPEGGKNYWGCWPTGANCQYYAGDMTPAPRLRDRQARKLLTGVSVPAQTEAPAAVELVLDSLMLHDNLAPFVSKRLIQHLVSSNPDPAYVARVAKVFRLGTFSVSDASGSYSFGTGRRGDLAATVAAILLDSAARDVSTEPVSGGQLRAPVLLFTGALRAFNGHTDGAPFGWWWGETLNQHVFMSPSVFSFYPPDYPVPGTALVGPEFGIHSTNSALERFNYLTYLFDWGGSDPDSNIPDALGTGVDFTSFRADASSPTALVDRISLLLLGKVLPTKSRGKVVAAVRFWTSEHGSDWRDRRIATAAYLVLSSPDYQVQR